MLLLLAFWLKKIPFPFNAVFEMNSTFAKQIVDVGENKNIFFLVRKRRENNNFN